MAKAFEVRGFFAPIVPRHVLQEVWIMDGVQQTSDQIRSIERVFEASRLAPQSLAAAYENVLPIVRRTWPAVPRTQRPDEELAEARNRNACRVMGA